MSRNDMLGLGDGAPDARLEASLADVRAGRVARHGGVHDLMHHLDGWPVRAIEEIADVNPRVDKGAIPDDMPVSFVPMPSVGAGDGSIHVEETRPAGEVKKGFTAFLEGDVLFAKIPPCMENGTMAVVPALVNGFGFGSTDFMCSAQSRAWTPNASIIRFRVKHSVVRPSVT